MHRGERMIIDDRMITDGDECTDESECCSHRFVVLSLIVARSYVFVSCTGVHAAIYLFGKGFHLHGPQRTCEGCKPLAKMRCGLVKGEGWRGQG